MAPAPRDRRGHFYAGYLSAPETVFHVGSLTRVIDRQKIEPVRSQRGSSPGRTSK
jgi:hypothetical protein